MNVQSRLVKLVKELINKTLNSPETSRLKWERVGVRAYEVSLTRTTLRISSEAPSGQYPFAFRIVDETGNVVEKLREEEGGPILHLSDLYNAAARSHTGIDDKLDEIFAELGINDEPPPF